MMRYVKRWTLIAVLLISGMLSTPTPARADDEDIATDARLEGYAAKVAVEDNGVSLIWLLFIMLTCVSCGVLFLDPKRSHLD